MRDDMLERDRFRVVWDEVPGDFPAVVHPGWAEAFPWLVQGTTMRFAAGTPFDLGLFSGASPPEDRVIRHWGDLRSHSGLFSIVHARQEHGAEVRFHREAPPGLSVTDSCDGHATRSADVLLAVATADCVPVFVVDPRRRAVSALHAGWRGTAAGVLERGIERLRAEAGSRPEDLLVHLGPAICGRCYEVGPEVFIALGQPPSTGPAPIDLRAVLAERAAVGGVPAESVTVSGHCTRCTAVRFFSHRGGDRERQVGFLGVRP